MSPKRLIEWLGTVEGTGKTVAAVVGVPAVIWAAATKFFDPVVAFFGLPHWTSTAGTAFVVAAFGLLLWWSLRNFSQASRVEQPDAFTLHPTTPASLIGRSDELTRLLSSVKRNQLVLLDGESGCGKSALVGVGLVPELNRSDDLLPLLITDWGEDWVRGPLAAALDALFHSVSDTKRERLRWISAPDLSGTPVNMAADLEARLKAAFDVLGRRPLLIADQFDDYQARHRQRFLDEEGNWVAPAALAQVNQFWEVVSTGLIEGRLHLLVVTRSDTSAGLACVRFLSEDQTATRTLPRVDVDYLHPLLVAITDAQSSVVSNPENGWYALRDRVERDLKAEGAVLMQQVRTVLLGLRQLPLLTPRDFRAVGGLRGVETLVVSRALRKAGDAAGGQDGERSARAVLGALVLHGGPAQPPKALRASLNVLGEIAGGPSCAEVILRVLQDNEVVRPAVSTSGVNTWQLDHDYLARAVLSEARQADRWAVALREGKTRYDDARSDWRRRWVSLLPSATLVRICWERLRHRLKFGEASRYALVSAIKPAIFALFVVATLITAFRWYEDRQLTAQVLAIDGQLSGSDPDGAVLEAWRAPKRLRQRLHEFVLSNPGRFERAIEVKWPLADSGLEPARLQEAAAAVLIQLEQSRPSQIDSPENFADTYADLAERLGGTDVKRAASAVREYLVKEPNALSSTYLSRAYATLLGEFRDGADVTAEAIALRSALEQAGRKGFYLSVAYEGAASQLNDQVEATAAATSLRKLLLSNVQSDDNLDALGRAYAVVAARLVDPVEVESAASTLRELLEQRRSSVPDRRFGFDMPDFLDIKLGGFYATVAPKLSDGSARSEAAKLRPLVPVHDSGSSPGLALAYAAVALRVGDAEELKKAASVLQEQLERSSTFLTARDFVESYLKVAAQISDQAYAKSEAQVLRLRMANTSDSEMQSTLAEAYAAIGAKVEDEAAVKAATYEMRTRLMEEQGVPANSFRFATAYALLVAQLKDPAAVKSEVNILRAASERTPSILFASRLGKAYAAAAVRSPDEADVRAAANTLRSALEEGRSDGSARGLAIAYGIVAKAMVERADPKGRRELVREILTLAGQPFVGGVEGELLSALQPAARTNFGCNVGRAVEWAQHTYGTTPDQLRPSQE
jgi:hypothetical protein